MKIRSGFVSNSSSSSFIVGVGLIRPGKEHEVAKIFGEENIESLIDALTDDQRCKWDVPELDNGGDTVTMKSFDYRSADIYGVWDKLKTLGVDDINIVYFSENGSEPEWDDENGSYNYSWYDNDPDAFDECDARKYRLLKENRDLFVDGDAVCGGGYNG